MLCKHPPPTACVHDRDRLSAWCDSAPAPRRSPLPSTRRYTQSVGCAVPFAFPPLPALRPCTCSRGAALFIGKKSVVVFQSCFHGCEMKMLSGFLSCSPNKPRATASTALLLSYSLNKYCPAATYLCNPLLHQVERSGTYWGFLFI